MDKVFVYSLESLSGYGIKAEREGTDVADLYVNDQKAGSFSTEIIDNDISIHDNIIIVNCNGMKMGTFTLIK